MFNMFWVLVVNTSDELFAVTPGVSPEEAEDEDEDEDEDESDEPNENPSRRLRLLELLLLPVTT
jgi:hypothetical protein